MPPYTKSEEAKHDLIDIPETSENKKSSAATTTMKKTRVQ